MLLHAQIELAQIDGVIMNPSRAKPLECYLVDLMQGDRIWMDRQLRNYDNTISKLESMIEGPVSEYLKKCLYTVNIGSNDYINNYFMPQHYNTKDLFTSNEYAQLLVSRYQPQLQVILF